MPGRNHPALKHAGSPAGALPASPSIAQIEQEDLAPARLSVLVEHNGPITSHELPSRSGSAFSQIFDSGGSTQQLLGKDLKRKRALIVSTDNPFYYAARDQANPNSAAAALWPANVVLEITHADEVHIAGATADQVSTIAVITENFDG